MIMDLHNHTVFSYDGSNSPEQIIENAISNGIDVIGITDHQFTIKNRLGEYIKRMSACKEKYSSQIKVLAGLEISMSPSPDELFSADTDGLDFVLFERLDRPGAADLYDFLSLRRRFKCPVGLAHCDIFKLGERYGKDMLKLMRDENIFCEINTSGNYDYYYDFLTSTSKREAVRQSGIGVSIGSDTHAIFEFRKEQIIRANELRENMGLPLPFAECVSV